jgi:hypothetical protein
VALLLIGKQITLVNLKRSFSIEQDFTKGSGVAVITGTIGNNVASALVCLIIKHSFHTTIFRGLSPWTKKVLHTIFLKTMLK